MSIRASQGIKTKIHSSLVGFWLRKASWFGTWCLGLWCTFPRCPKQPAAKFALQWVRATDQIYYVIVSCRHHYNCACPGAEQIKIECSSRVPLLTGTFAPPSWKKTLQTCSAVVWYRCLYLQVRGHCTTTLSAWKPSSAPCTDQILCIRGCGCLACCSQVQIVTHKAKQKYCAR